MSSRGFCSHPGGLQCDFTRRMRNSSDRVITTTDLTEREETAMSEVDDFLALILPRQIEAETALHNGNPAPRIAMWSTKAPASLFGGWGPCKTDPEEVTRISRWVASRFSKCTAYDFEVVAAGASGDLAYTVGYERCTRSLDGGPAESTVLRVTHVYRRENGEWKIVHRHGDILPVDQSPPKT